MVVKYNASCHEGKIYAYAATCMPAFIMMIDWPGNQLTMVHYFAGAEEGSIRIPVA